MNVILDGVNEIADTVLVKMRAQKGPHYLFVAPSGQASIYPQQKSWRHAPAPNDADLVGLYTLRATHKQIREDLEVRLSEIRA